MKFITRAAIAAAFLCLLTTSANADVIVHVSDDGVDLTYHMLGTMDVTGAAADNTGSSTEDRTTINQLFSFSGALHRKNGSGTVSGSAVPGAGYTSDPGNGVGQSFGFSGTALFWDDALGFDPGVIVVDRKFTVAGRTIATQFGGSLDAGPTLAWTHDTSGDTITLSTAAAVPEPSSLALLGLASFAGCFIRRRRK